MVGTSKIPTKIQRIQHRLNKFDLLKVRIHWTILIFFVSQQCTRVMGILGHNQRFCFKNSYQMHFHLIIQSITTPADGRALLARVCMIADVLKIAPDLSSWLSHSVTTLSEVPFCFNMNICLALCIVMGKYLTFIFRYCGLYDGWGVLLNPLLTS